MNSRTLASLSSLSNDSNESNDFLTKGDFILLSNAVRGKRLAKDIYAAKLNVLINYFPKSIKFHGLEW